MFEKEKQRHKQGISSDTETVQKQSLDNENTLYNPERKIKLKKIPPIQRQNNRTEAQNSNHFRYRDRRKVQMIENEKRRHQLGVSTDAETVKTRD